MLQVLLAKLDRYYLVKVYAVPTIQLCNTNEDVGVLQLCKLGKYL
jgi:hypothetical protein